MIETHPFGSFVPVEAYYLLLGSFTGQDSGNWFYGTKRNQFWKILSEVYGRELVERNQRENLFRDLRLAVTDVIYQCERAKGSNLDNNLINIVYNIKMIEEIIENNKIEKIFFSSRFVENKFKQLFKDRFGKIELVTLPSPSPRYARLSLSEKIEKYKSLLPRLK